MFIEVVVDGKEILGKSGMGIKRVYSFSLSLDTLFPFFFRNFLLFLILRSCENIDRYNVFQTIFLILGTHKSYLYRVKRNFYDILYLTITMEFSL